MGNKSDLAEDQQEQQTAPSLVHPSLPSAITPSFDSGRISHAHHAESISFTKGLGLGAQNTATVAPEGREVTAQQASEWASSSEVPVYMEVSALSGVRVDETFARLASMILTKIELGEIDPDDPQSGIQYGDSGEWATGGYSEVGSVKSDMTTDGGGTYRRRERNRRRTRMNGMREWEEVFRIDPVRRRGCC